MKLYISMILLAITTISCGQPPAFVRKELPGSPSKDDNDSIADANKNPNTKSPVGVSIGESDVIVNIGKPKNPIPKNDVTADSCREKGLKLVAPNIVFTIDNSGSNKGNGSTEVATDCPDKVDNKCTGETVRKKTLLHVVGELRTLDAQNADSAATSYYSIVEFATNAQLRLGTSSTSGVPNLDVLSGIMDFTKTPEGYTSYVSAFNMAQSILSSSANPSVSNKPKVVIKITDGFPTNKPEEVLAAAKAVKNTGAKIITIVYTREDLFSTVASQWEKSADKLGFSKAQKDWTLGRGRDSIISDISDHALLVKDVSKLPEVVSYLVNRVALKCE